MHISECGNTPVLKFKNWSLVEVITKPAHIKSYFTTNFPTINYRLNLHLNVYHISLCL